MGYPIAIRWAKRTPFKTDPGRAYDEIERIRTKFGHPTVKQFVTEFSKKRSPLHRELEWNDTIAGQKYREVQAGQILRSLIVRYRELPDIETRAYRVFDSDEHDAETHRSIRCYTSTAEALADPEIRAQVLAMATAELIRWRKEYAALNELALVFSAIDKIAATN